MGLRNHSHRADAPVESRMGKRPKSGERLLPIPRSEAYFHFEVGRISSFGLNRYGSSRTGLKKNDGGVRVPEILTPWKRHFGSTRTLCQTRNDVL